MFKIQNMYKLKTLNMKQKMKKKN